MPFAIVDERQAALHARKYEHIIIDTRARPDEEDLKALALCCHLLVIPCTPDPMSLRTLQLTVRALQSIGADRYRIVLTIVPPKPQRDGDDAREMLTGVGLPVFASSIRRLVAFQRAVLQGTTVKEVGEPRAALGWTDYEELGQEILTTTRVAEETSTHARSV